MGRQLDLFKQPDDVKKNEVSKLPNPSTSLEFILFNNHFDKLVLKILNSSRAMKDAKTCRTLSDILTLTYKDLSQLKGIGAKYITLWEELVKLYENNLISYQKPQTVVQLLQENQFDCSKIRINFSALDKKEKKNLKKLMRMYPPYEITTLLKYDPKELGQQKGVGKDFISSISSLKNKVLEELNEVLEGIINLDNMESKLFISTKSIKLPPERVADILLEDIDDFLDLLSEDEQDIFQSRWGFVEEEQTLEELGDKHSLTRERIRQKEKNINQELFKYLRLTKENILLSLEGSLSPQLSEQMSCLSCCFDIEKNFYDFLGFVTGEKNLYKIIRPNVSKDLMNDFFTQNTPCCNLTEAKAYIDNNYKKLIPENILKYLHELGMISIEDNQVSPLNLSKHEAVACVLNEYPSGLPWDDITQLVNTKKLSRTNLNEGRIDPSGFHDSELVYLAGKGIYKHTKYINLSGIDLEQVFNNLEELFHGFGRETLHLNELYKKSSFLQKYDYYVVRYVVKMFGKDYGIYFDGKSQVDTVSLQKKFKRITQRDVIVQAMTERKKAMTKAEIAALLKSKSLNHAGYYLDSMMYDGLVVQVDRMLYTTPEIGYERIDLSLYGKEVQAILDCESRPVDPSIFQKMLNEKLGESYSKYFYSSVARYCSLSNHWFRKQNLYAKCEINYKNLTDAISSHCDPEKNISDNVALLQRYIAITDESAKISIRNWLSGLE